MFYKLDDNKNVIPCSAEEWEKLREEMFMNATKHIADDEINDKRISTVWLGLDHKFVGSNKPHVFETMVFTGDSGIEDYCERYSTWKEAEEGHQRAIEWVKNGCKDEEDI